jgi:hypothetical protein
VEVIHGTFDESMTSTLEYLEEQKKRLAPAFVMVDPFGVKGTPMSVIRGILQNRRCEVYVSFMYEAINRWKKAPQFEEHLDALFGCQEWRDGRDIGDSSERKKFFYDLFEKQLRDAGAKHVIRFELYEENRFVYAIFFAAQELTGADRMKAAIWNADPSGDFRFRGTKQGVNSTWAWTTLISSLSSKLSATGSPQYLVPLVGLAILLELKCSGLPRLMFSDSSLRARFVRESWRLMKKGGLKREDQGGEGSSSTV